MSIYSTLNLEEVEEDQGGEFAPLPAGDYDMVVMSAQLMDNSAGTGQNVKVQLSIPDTADSHAGRQVFENFVVKHTNTQSEQIGLSQFKAFLAATGDAPNYEALAGKSLRVKLGIKPARGQYPAGNKIVKCYPKAAKAKPAVKSDNTVPF